MIRGRRWAYPAILIVVTLCLTLVSFGQARARTQARARVEEELSILLGEGFYKEALSKIQGLKSEDRSFFSFHELTALVGMGNLNRAEAFLDRDRDFQQKGEGSQLIFQAWKGKQAYDRAYLFLKSHQADFSQEDYRGSLLDLLRKQRVFPCQSAFQTGWFDGVSILRDKQGAYLVDGSGRGLNFDRYEEIRPIQGGFMAKRKDYWVRLDKRGRFGGLTDGEEKILEKEKDFFFERRQSQGLWGFDYQGKSILPCEYERLSPLSSKGVAFGQKEGAWYRIVFPALSQGIGES